MLIRIEENELYDTELIGSACEDSMTSVKGLVDIIFGEEELSVDYSFFDIRGAVLLYGITGVGKTTIARNCMNYAITEYGVDAYTVNVSDIIVSSLGETVHNLHTAIEDFNDLEKGILFIDEIDKLFINRSADHEVSELKRLLIEMMGFIDKLSLNQKKLSNELVRCIYELKTLCINGISPNVFTCGNCGRKEFLDYFDGNHHTMLCTYCHGTIPKHKQVRTSTLYALQYVATSPVEKLYTFTVNDEVLSQMGIIIHEYMKKQVDKKFKSLEIY